MDSVANGGKEDTSDARAGLIGSVMALAAEESMRQKRVINLQEMLKQVHGEGMAQPSGD